MPAYLSVPGKIMNDVITVRSHILDNGEDIRGNRVIMDGATGYRWCM